MQRKYETRIKTFTSQIQTLPGPKETLVHNLYDEETATKKVAKKQKDEKNLLKN